MFRLLFCCLVLGSIPGCALIEIKSFDSHDRSYFVPGEARSIQSSGRVEIQSAKQVLRFASNKNPFEECSKSDQESPALLIPLALAAFDMIANRAGRAGEQKIKKFVSSFEYKYGARSPVNIDKKVSVSSGEEDDTFTLTRFVETNPSTAARTGDGLPTVSLTLKCEKITNNADSTYRLVRIEPRKIVLDYAGARTKENKPIDFSIKITGFGPTNSREDERVVYGTVFETVLIIPQVSLGGRLEFDNSKNCIVNSTNGRCHTFVTQPFIADERMPDLHLLQVEVIERGSGAKQFGNALEQYKSDFKSLSGAARTIFNSAISN